MKMDPDKLERTLQSITEAAQKFREMDPYLLIESHIADDLEEVDDTLWELIDLTEE